MAESNREIISCNQTKSVESIPKQNKFFELDFRTELKILYKSSIPVVIILNLYY